MAKWKKPDGTEIDLGEGVNDAQVTAIGTIVKESLAPVTASLGETVTSAVAEALKPVTERLDKVEAGGPTDPEADPASGGGKGKGGKGGDDQTPAWAKGLIETVGKISSERESEQKARTTGALVKAYLDKAHPNMDAKRRAILERRALAAAPKDDAAMKAVVEEVKQEWTDAGVDTAKAFSADPAKEGATAADPAAGDLEAQKQRNLKRLREQGRGGLKPAAR